MKDFFRAGVLILGGVFVGIYLYATFGLNRNPLINYNDSLLVDQLYAQDENLDQANSEINYQRRNIITAAVEKISPAVVSVNVLQLHEIRMRSPFRSRDPILREIFPELFKDRYMEHQVESLGSGFLVSEDGYILTNDHVVTNAKKIVVTMEDGRKFDAVIVGTDQISDIALLKVESEEKLPFIKFGNSDDVIIGEWAIAIGNPFGLFEKYKKPTVTVGVVSAVDRDFGASEEGRYYEDMIQTDASINHGNSGGPLCNALGEAIGMNTFIYTGSRYSEGSVGVGFAIPINRINRILDDLKTNHEVNRDFWVGIKVQNLNSVIARKIGFNSIEGVIVTSIDRKSPAEKSGLQLEDIILQIGDKKIKNDRDVFEVFYATDLKVGDELNIIIWRNGNTMTLPMKLTSFEDR